MKRVLLLLLFAPMMFNGCNTAKRVRVSLLKDKIDTAVMKAAAETTSRAEITSSNYEYNEIDVTRAEKMTIKEDIKEYDNSASNIVTIPIDGAAFRIVNMGDTARIYTTSGSIYTVAKDSNGTKSLYINNRLIKHTHRDIVIDNSVIASQHSESVKNDSSTLDESKKESFSNTSGNIVSSKNIKEIDVTRDAGSILGTARWVGISLIALSLLYILLMYVQLRLSKSKKNVNL